MRDREFLGQTGPSSHTSPLKDQIAFLAKALLLLIDKLKSSALHVLQHLAPLARALIELKVHQLRYKQVVGSHYVTSWRMLRVGANNKT